METEYVLIRKLEHLTGTATQPGLDFAVETRDRAGPIHKHGAFENDTVWVQLHGGLFIAKAKVKIGWVGEYSNLREVRARTNGSDLFALDSFWTGRPRFGYAGVVSLKNESWVEPFWAGPRTYGYEVVRLEDEKKRNSWLEKRDPPRGGESLLPQFKSWLAGR